MYFRLQPIVGITPTVNFDFTAGDLGSYQINGIDLSDPAQLRYTILFDNTYRSRRARTRPSRTDWTYDLDAGFLKAVELRRALRPTSIRSRIRCAPTSARPAASRRPRCRRYLTLHSNPASPRASSPACRARSAPPTRW